MARLQSYNGLLVLGRVALEIFLDGLQWVVGSFLNDNLILVQVKQFIIGVFFVMVLGHRQVPVLAGGLFEVLEVGHLADAESLLIDVVVGVF